MTFYLIASHIPPGQVMNAFDRCMSSELAVLAYGPKAFQNRSQQASKKDGWILKASFGQKCVDLGGLCPPVRGRERGLGVAGVEGREGGTLNM